MERGGSGMAGVGLESINVSTEASWETVFNEGASPPFLSLYLNAIHNNDSINDFHSYSAPEISILHPRRNT